MPEVALTFVACSCGEMHPINDTHCPACGRPTGVPRCVECGDAENGPWLQRDGRCFCEECAA